MSDIGVYGLAIMGQNLALNIASKGYIVSIANRSYEKVAHTLERSKLEFELGTAHFNGKPLQLIGSKDFGSFVKSIIKPRKIIILVQAGKAVDETIEQMSVFLEPGDILIDGGNEWYPNSIR